MPKVNPSSLKKYVFLLLLLCVVFPSPSYAYFDPGTGSYLLKLLIAGLVMASLTLKTLWFNLARFAAGFFSKKERNERESSR